MDNGHHVAISQYDLSLGTVQMLEPYSDVSSGDDNNLPSPHYRRAAT